MLEAVRNGPREARELSNVGLSGNGAEEVVIIRISSDQAAAMSSVEHTTCIIKP